jgi:hypothetical protein
VAAALTAPLAIAALVLGVAGGSKLRSPEAAVAALASVGLPRGAGIVRALGVGELVLGIWTFVSPGRAVALALAALYAAFACLALILASRSAACGCFGESGAPATRGHASLSAAVAVVCAAAAIWPPASVFSRSLAVAVPLAIGVAGAVYATVLAYTQLPRAWNAWSPR